jgi:hypothetical protein
VEGNPLIGFTHGSFAMRVAVICCPFTENEGLPVTHHKAKKPVFQQPLDIHKTRFMNCQNK